MGSLACLLVLLLARVAVVPQASPAGLVPIFANGTEGYTCFRIPAIVRSLDGTLLAFAEARRESCADFGDVRIVMRRSRDAGKSWGPLQVVAENGSLQAGNAAPVVDALDRRFPRGRIFLIYCTGDAPESELLRGHGTRRVWYRTSTDDGATWTPPVEITASVKLPAWRAYATGPGHALQLTRGQLAGRIVVAANHTEGNIDKANTFYTDDHGATWLMGATVNLPGSNESTAAQVSDGTIVLSSRDQNGSGARFVSLSHDGAEHWDTTFVARDLPDPECEGSMIAHGPWLLLSNAGNSKCRWDLTVSASRDGGHTWPRHTVIYAGPAAYSDIVLLPKHRLGMLWERGDEGGIVFLTRPLQPLI